VFGIQSRGRVPRLRSFRAGGRCGGESAPTPPRSAALQPHPQPQHLPGDPGDDRLRTIGAGVADRRAGDRRAVGRQPDAPSRGHRQARQGRFGRAAALPGQLRPGLLAEAGQRPLRDPDGAGRAGHPTRRRQPLRCRPRHPDRAARRRPGGARCGRPRRVLRRRPAVPLHHRSFVGQRDADRVPRAAAGAGAAGPPRRQPGPRSRAAHGARTAGDLGCPGGAGCRPRGPAHGGAYRRGSPEHGRTARRGRGRPL
ncbi:MAG: Transcriptional regulator, GntR family, partial [uncultured Thermomicrobiales bacterium]